MSTVLNPDQSIFERSGLREIENLTLLRPCFRIESHGVSKAIKGINS